MGGPLAGVRVVELAALGAAPYGVMLLADLGAEVVVVDRPGGAGEATAHVGLRRGRRSIVVDLKHPRGPAVVERLLDGADVLVEGFRPGVMERLGLGPDTVRASRPGLVYARMTGWGQHGPLAARAGHDLNFAALAGVVATLGPAGAPPEPAVNYLADLGGGGTFLAIGVLAALLERARTGRGRVLDVAMIDGAASLTAFVRGLVGLGAWTEERGGNLLDGGAPFYATYACADGRFVAVGAIEPPFFAALMAGLGLDPAWPQHERARWPELRAALTAAFAGRDRDAWTAAFDGVDACVTPVLTLEEVAAHPHHRARATFTVVPGLPLPAPAPAPRFGPEDHGGPEGGQGTVAPPPRPGGQTREVLRAAGCTDAEVDELLAAGAVAAE
jgi:alpha-methylacyl-CoA racemase